MQEKRSSHDSVTEVIRPTTHTIFELYTDGKALTPASLALKSRVCFRTVSCASKTIGDGPVQT